MDIKVKRYLTEAAKQLPVTYRDQTVIRQLLGSQVIAAGKTTYKDDKGNTIIIQPDKKYRYKITDKVPVDHAKRLIDLYNKGGDKLAAKYIDELGAMINKQPHKIGGIKLQKI